MSDPVPSRALLDHLSARQTRVGHGEEGFVSSSHGFLPIEVPRPSLPASHAAWDQVADQLPLLFRAGGLRRTLESLPNLPADPEHLEDDSLCRAASLLGIFAHAYAREREAASRPLSGGDALARYGFEEDREGKLPPEIETPWRTVCLRLGRPGACLSISDLVLYNWRLRDPNGPRLVENLDLNTPTTGVDEERFFYMTIVESLALTAPALEQIIRAQEACLQDDPDTLKSMLLSLADGLRSITLRTLHKIDPNPHGPHHTDPIIWSRFVAPFAAPVRMVEPGLSGAAAPVFHLFDAFFRRPRHDTKIGREKNHLAVWSPRNTMKLVDAIRAVDVPAWVEHFDDSELRGIWRHTLESYAGSHGWLGAHRLKVYGFMETGFKAGRTATNGGFSGNPRNGPGNVSTTNSTMPVARGSALRPASAWRDASRCVRPRPTKVPMSFASASTSPAPACGFWMVVRGQVYDITEFLDTHPGGQQILMASAGTDATRSYEAVEHHLNPEVHAMLDLFKIAAIRRLDFSGSWGVTLTTAGITTLMLSDCFSAWVRALYQVAEVENALLNNQTLRRKPATRGEPANDRNALKARVILELRTALEQSVVDGLVSAIAQELGQLTTGLFDASAHLDALNERVRAVKVSASAMGTHDLLEEAQHLIGDLGFPQGDRDRAALEKAWRILDLLEEEAAILLRKLKLTLSEGVRPFETHEGHTPERASQQVMDALRRVPELLAEHHDAIHGRAQELGLLPVPGTPLA